MPTFRFLAIALLLPTLLLPLLTGCERNDTTATAERATKPPAPTRPGCLNCHPVQLDPDHSFACQTCHHGDASADTAESAHRNLIGLPAHPYNMQQTCGQCHPQQTANAATASHFTISRAVNLVRTAFGATAPLTSLTEIPVTEPPTTILALADDLLRRRCLRCHLYYQGGPYPETEHGTGCAACHLTFHDNALQSHQFRRYPADDQCLHCHFGNRVGSDYYGRYERDFSREFRTPYRNDDTYPRPYGVEYHQLQPDIHQQAGISCVDCHSGAQLMTGNQRQAEDVLTCKSCHDWQPGQPAPATNLVARDKRLVLVTRADRRELVVPPMRNPVHRQYQNKATCVACHAQWSFNDQATHLIRQDSDDYEPWRFLTVQGSIEVEAQLENNLYGDDDSEPSMIDKVTGERRPGLWHKGFEQRRWETMLLCKDKDGRLTVCRPSLDLHLSYINDEEEVLFDSAATTSTTQRIRPYTPHTIGKAGSFFKQRLSANNGSTKQEQP